jgi:hypothetical protein
MSLEQTIKDTIIAESQDLDGRLQQLVRAGLMPSNTIPVLRKAIAKVQGGMTLQGAERDVMANFINSMMFIVLGDDSIFNKARAGAKTYATEAKEKQEYDYEGDMAMSQLKSIIANSQRMHDSLSEDTNLPEWVQSKITLAEDYISTAANYLQGEVNEEQIDELSTEKLLAYRKKAREADTNKHHVYADEADKKIKKKTGVYNPGLLQRAKAKLRNEEVEQIDELSKKTMGSYVKKASGAEQPKNVMSPKNVPLTKIAAYQGDSETGHFGKRFNQATYDKAERLRKNRETGIKRAVDKITKEEVEQVDELSKATLKSYGNKASDQVRDYVTDKSTSFKASMNNMKREKGLQSLQKRKTNEEVEQVDEISKATMGRYINKAKDSIDNTSYRSGIKDGTAISSSTPYKSNNPLEKKLTKRHKGISMAVKKLTKEDIDTAKSMHESYKMKFDAALEHYNIKSPSELGEEKRKEFFNHVDQEFKKGDN